MSWRTPRFSSPFLPWLILANVIFASVIGVISATAGYVADSTIQGALQMSNDDLRWISVSFIMMLGIILPLGIYLAVRYGYKIIFFYGLAVFVFGSLLNSLAFDFWSLLISRAIAGAGAGALFPLSIAIIAQIFPKDKLTLPLALYVGLGFGIGTVLGYLVGGYFVQYISWQSPFFLCFLLGLPSLLLTALLHKETEPGEVHKFDTWGYVAFIFFISNLLLILNSAKADWNTQGWTSPFIITCSILAVLSLLILIPLELRNPHPLIIFSLFKTRSFLLGCITIFFVGAPLYTTQILSVIFLDYDLHYEKHTIGVFLLTTGLTLGIVSSCAAFLTKFFNIRFLTLTGMVLITISCWINPNVTIYSSHGQLLWMWNLRMIGIGLALGPATAYAMSDITPALAGAASVFITFARQMGGTLGSLSAQVITIERQEFHNEMFGAQVDTSSPAFQEVARHLQSHLIHNTGATPAEAPHLADSIIRANVLTQSHAAAQNDAFFLLGLATFAICISILLEMGWEAYKKRKQINLA
ncbi:MAG TPA: MFS transporter [Rhabdochlamydiaceae bacterium]|nr:MFS transporter [Rhabdochlamydiaceae bacterium]